MNAVLHEARRLGVRSPIDALRFARNFAVTVWDPKDSDIAQGIRTLVRGEIERLPADAIERYEAEHPGVAALFREGYDPDMEPARLAELPVGTVGHAYGRMILDQGLDPLATLLAFGTPTNSVHYGIRRAYKLHDVMHIVLGCDTSILGEVRIVSYSLGQSLTARDGGDTSEVGAGSISSAMAYVVLLMHLALRRPLTEFGEAVRLGAEWMELGRRSPDHVAVRIEELMDQPIDVVRRRVLGTEASASRRAAGPSPR